MDWPGIIAGGITTLAGTAIGWWLSQLNVRLARKRKHLDDFESAIREQLQLAYDLPDKIDEKPVDFWRDSTRKLESMTRYIQTTHPKQWKKIKPAWDDYALKLAPFLQPMGGAAVSVEAKPVERQLILDALQPLLYTVSRI